VDYVHIRESMGGTNGFAWDRRRRWRRRNKLKLCPIFTK
jgi:hypothetical protein